MEIIDFLETSELAAVLAFLAEHKNDERYNDHIRGAFVCLNNLIAQATPKPEPLPFSDMPIPTIAYPAVVEGDSDEA